jgi:hypothetical protein
VRDEADGALKSSKIKIVLKATRALHLFLVLVLLATISGCATTEGPKPEQHLDILSGVWDVDFDMGNNTVHSQMTLKQDGSSFFGEGTDANNVPFSIVNGQINGDQLDFFKKYPSNPPTTVTYHGTLSQVNDADYQGPYLSGSYLVESNGSRVSGNWRAQMPSKLKAQAQVAANQPPPRPALAASDKSADNAQPPVLSGSWDAAYEYNFGIVHSVMVLNQKENNVTGHGVDSNTQEKFAIENGHYKYPNLTFVRSYKKGKGAKTDRNIIFKATVSTVKDADYEGPYLSGKTQWGGSWEAQLQSNAKPSLSPDKNSD